MAQDNTAEILPIAIEDEMQDSYLDYAMSVIVSRAIPDVTDGLKPVHRRILYAMGESHCDWNKPYRKSARTVGEVMGKYHPHGDTAIYDALVRMAQDFSLRAPLIDGQGNFGSMDGDSPAAMRYTESRLAKISHSILDDLDKDTVDFQPNYDGAEHEPVVLPAKFPNLLVNGAGGIAVGMATNIPPHNLGEVVDGCLALIENPQLTEDELFEIIPGPDFPTGGIILGRKGSYAASKTGRGSVIMRGKTHFETIGNREAIVVTEMPYQVNKALMLEKIGQLVRDKRIEGIAEMRDESDKDGVRVVVELKRDAIPDVVLNQLFTFTQLQTNFAVNLLALDRGKPRLMNIRDVLVAFIRFREEVVTRRTTFLLGKARDRAHILIGLSMAVANIDEVITLIKSAKDPSEAKEKLLARSWPATHVKPLIDLVADRHNTIEEDGTCYFTETQARAILDMRLSKLTGLEQEKINEELAELAKEIEDYLDILRSRERLFGIICTELQEVRNNFANERRTTFEESEYEHDIEDLIPREDMVVTVTMGGYIKRVPLSTYRAQRRGGKGRSGMSMHDEDITTRVFVTNTHTSMLFFSTTGKVYKTKVYKLPEGSPQSKGRALINIFPLEKDETINVVMPLPENEEDWDKLSIMFATRMGTVRRNLMSDFKYVPSNGKYAMKLEGEDDALISVRPCHDDEHIFIATNQGKAVRFPVEGVRVFKSRTSTGVRAIKLAKGDYAVSMATVRGAEGADVETRANYLKIPVETRMALHDALREGTDQPDLNAILADVDSELDFDTICAFAKDEQFILTVTENGYGKRSSVYEYRATNRGGSGIVNIVTSARNGNVAASYQIEPNDQIILITESGKLIRCPVEDIRIAGRATQGVTIFRTDEGEKVISVARIRAENVESDDEDGEDSGESTEQNSDGGE